MRAHEKPSFRYNFNLQREIEHLDEHFSQPDRQIPQRSSDNLLIATWNMTNFGLQRRTDNHLRLMAHMIQPFDVVAVQEMADDLRQFYRLVQFLGDSWDYFFTDIGGNKERLGYLYRTDRAVPNGLAAELAMRGYERDRIFIADEPVAERTDFDGFNRNPYMLGFTAENFEFSLVNVHLYWSDFTLRRLETRALARWAEKRSRRDYPPSGDIILLGDFNLPRLEDGDPIFSELQEAGLTLPSHDTNAMGTNLGGSNHYDQIAFFPGQTGRDFTGRMGVCDFDNALFPDLWDNRTGAKKFGRYVRYYVADHRPMWAEFRR